MKVVVATLGLVLLLAVPAEARRLRPVAKLTATAAASGVRLAWKDRARGETRYEVRRRGRKARLRANRRTWTDRRAAPATRYRYTVRPCRRRHCARGRSVTITTRRRSGEPAAAAAGGGTGGRRCLRRQPDDRRLSGVPVRQPVEHGRLAGAGRHRARLRRLARLDDAVARLRRRRPVWHPVRQRPVHPAARPRSPSTWPTSPIPAPTPRRSTPPSRVAATATCWPCARATASSSSCTTRSARAAAGTPTAARPGTCAPTRCARSGGPRRTPRGCRSSPASRAATRPTAASSATRCGSPSPTPSGPTSTRPRTGRRRAPTARCRRWACGCG